MLSVYGDLSILIRFAIRVGYIVTLVGCPYIVVDQLFLHKVHPETY